MSSLPRSHRIGVAHRPSAGDWPARLLAALEQAFPVRFERRGEGEWADLDALVSFGDVSTAQAAAAAGVRALALVEPESASGERAVAVSLAGTSALEHSLRGQLFEDCWLGSAAALAEAPGELLAASEEGPIWARAGELDLAAVGPLELAPEEALRERLQERRCVALLPLVHLLRELTRDTRWQPAAARASVVFDDPNLHWPSYGFLDLERLHGHAREHGYHVALAMVPLGSWFAHPGAARLVRENAAALSLVVHGNDHVARELGRPRDEREGVALAAQALRRVHAFERRSGVHVDRVMIPPHEACSEATVRGLLRCGFEAISMTRPYPWLEEPGVSWLTRPPGATPLVGWGPADPIAGGLPVMLRHPFAIRSSAELALRAFLDQPLILYGHHEDLAEGLEVLADSVADVDRVSAPRWCSLEQIARSNYQTRVEGSVLRVRPFSRLASVELPEGVAAIAVELPSGQDAGARLSVGGKLHPLDSRGIAEPLPVTGSRVEVELAPAGAVEPLGQRPRAPRPFALARRFASEGRDRALPLLTRTHLVRATSDS